ncbi:hypothetical protein ACQY0O_001008 [Thecaphora frezii]
MLFNLAPLALLALSPLASATSVGFGKLGETVQCLRALSQRSCHSTYKIPADSSANCCYNGALEAGAVESGLFLATQFWDADPATGPKDHTTIHGLWPDRCDGTYPSYCSNTTGIPEYTGDQIRTVIAKYDPKLLAYMNLYYKGFNQTDESFWEHEYNKHGTCITTMRTECQIPFPGISKEDFAVLSYFRQIVHLFKKLPTHAWLSEAGIIPAANKTYSLQSIQNALSRKHGGVPYIGCSKGAFTEAWYYFTVKGPVNFGQYFSENSTSKSSCPDQVKYLPKVL